MDASLHLSHVGSSLPLVDTAYVLSIWSSRTSHTDCALSSRLSSAKVFFFHHGLQPRSFPIIRLRPRSSSIIVGQPPITPHQTPSSANHIITHRPRSSSIIYLRPLSSANRIITAFNHHHASPCGQPHSHFLIFGKPHHHTSSFDNYICTTFNHLSFLIRGQPHFTSCNSHHQPHHRPIILTPHSSSVNCTITPHHYTIHHTSSPVKHSPANCTITDGRSQPVLPANYTITHRRRLTMRRPTTPSQMVGANHFRPAPTMLWPTAHIVAGQPLSPATCCSRLHHHILAMAGRRSANIKKFKKKSKYRTAHQSSFPS